MSYKYNPFTGELDRVDSTSSIPDDYANEYVTDSGTAMPAAHIINFLGNAAQGVSSSASGDTVTYTVANATASTKGVASFNILDFTVVNGAVSLASQPLEHVVTDVSGPVSPTAGGDINFTGSTNIYSNGSVANTVRLELQGTNHALFVGRGTNTPSTSLALGTAAQILQSGGVADPVWSSATYPSTAAQGDIFYGSATNVISALPKDTNATRYLSNTGTSNNPAWAQINLSNGVVNTLGATNGGTAQSTYATGDILYASGVNTLAKLPAGSNGNVLTLAGGIPSWAAGSSGTVTSVSGTANRITSTGGTTPVIDISASYVGQSSITTLGTVTTGAWNGTLIGPTFGGTGQNSYTTGDILYASASNVLSKLPIGSNTNVLTLVAGVPAWAAASSSGISSLTTDVSGPVSPSSGAVDTTGTNIYSDGSVANTLTLNLQGTNHGLFVGRGNTTPSANLSVGATGTVLTGNTGADPTFSATPNVTSISFSGGSALSNYTEGTFTPTFIGGTVAGTTTYTLQQGIYRRIGNLVYCHVSITTTANTGTGSISMGGFPFTPTGALVYTGYGAISNTGWTWPASTTSCYFELFAATQGTFRFYGSGTAVQTLTMQNTAMLIRFDIVYPI